MAIRRKGESIAAFRKRKERIKEQGKKNTKKLKTLKKKVVGKAKDKLGIARKTVKTKGGDFPVYGKDSKKAKSFRAAYAASAGTKTFTWEGKRYKSKGADKKTNQTYGTMAPPKEMSAKDKKKVKNKTFLNIASGPKPKGVSKEDLRKIDEERKRKKQKAKVKRRRGQMARADKR